MQSHSECGGLVLPAYLIMPVQRVPRYILFARDLLKSTPQWHPDAPLLRSALGVLEEQTARINQSKKEHERAITMRSKLSQIVSSDGDDAAQDLLADGRYFLMEARKWRAAAGSHCTYATRTDTPSNRITHSHHSFITQTHGRSPSQAIAQTHTPS